MNWNRRYEQGPQWTGVGVHSNSHNKSVIKGVGNLGSSSGVSASGVGGSANRSLFGTSSSGNGSGSFGSGSNSSSSQDYNK